MHSADIRLSRTLTFDFDKKDLNYEKETSGFLSSNYSLDSSISASNEASRIDLTSFKELSLSSSTEENGVMHRSSVDSENGDANFNSRFSEHGNEQEPQLEAKIQLPSATADAMETYVNISENIYCGSATGKSIAEESMPCECKYQPDVDDLDAACGDDNYCINRMMFMECTADDCPCGRYCRNRRFQLRQYARVDVIRTEKKGFGLRALTDLPTNAFIMEYIGEVIPNKEFIRRTKQYEASGLEHYYFMTLKTDEIIDATKKGCLARFINHSCNPNCVTQKWVVGKNMRIGIFTTRCIKAGEELTFDYKFERYGAQAQICYCGEQVCKGFIGGSFKNNSKINDESFDNEKVDSNRDEEDDDDDEDERKQSDSNDDEEEAVTLTQKRMLRKMNRRKSHQPLKNPDEMKSFVKRMLDSVGKAHLVTRLLRRLELTDKDTALGKEIFKRFIHLHGLKMLKFWLGEWKNDKEIIIRVFHVLSQLPLANRNGLEDCKMFDIVGKFINDEDEEVGKLAEQLLKNWEQLKSVYRIPKRNVVETPKLSNGHTNKDGTDDTDMSKDSQLSCQYDSSREFFDPDDDYYEYFSMDVNANEIKWRIEYPPRCVIPTAPRAMMDAKNGYLGYARHIRTPKPSSYLAHVSTGYNSDDVHPFHNSSFHNRIKSSDSSVLMNDTQSIDSASAVSVTTGPLRKLPSNWKFAYAEDGTIYYYHKYTGKTQWNFPEEKSSSIEGVNQSDLEDLVEKTIQDAEKKKVVEYIRSNSPAALLVSHLSTDSSQVATPLASRRGSDEVDGALNEAQLKKGIGKIVTKYLSSKQKGLWKDDKHLFKELARKITHHIVDREIQSSRKIQTMNSYVRTKVEKFIDAHGVDLVNKIVRKRKHPSTAPKEVQVDSPRSIVSEDTNKYSKVIFSPSVSPPNNTVVSLPENGTEWHYEDLHSSPVKKRALVKNDTIYTSNQSMTSTAAEYMAPSIIADDPCPNGRSFEKSSVQDDDGDEFQHNRSREVSPSDKSKVSRCAGEYVRPGYVKILSSGSYRYVSPNSTSSYYRSSSRYYSVRKSSPPAYYHRHSANSSKRGSLSDDDLDRRRRN